MQNNEVGQVFNLLVTTYRRKENEASSELFALLTSMGDRSPDIWLTHVSGLVAVKTSLDAAQVISEVANVVSSDPWKLRFILRLIPVERIVVSRLDTVQKAVREMAERIPRDETFRVTVEKRLTDLSQSAIVQAAAEVVDRKVNLDHPDWIVLIEVIGNVAGVSVLRPDQILSVLRKKRGD